MSPRNREYSSFYVLGKEGKMHGVWWMCKTMIKSLLKITIVKTDK